LLWILTSATSVKARNVRAGNGAGRVSLCEVEGPHWVTVEGRGVRRWRRGPCWRRAPVCRPLPSASR